MADNSAIEWTDATWNPIRGCTRVSPGCGGPGPHGGCYAEGIAARFSGPGQAYEGLAEMRGHKPRWTGKVVFVEEALTLPLRWRKPRRIFVNSMSDLFHESVSDEWIDRIFAVMALCPQHTFQVLTKRADRMRAYMTNPATRDRVDAAMSDIAPAHWCTREIEDFGGWPLRNILLGVSVEDQRRADERRPDLEAVAAAGWTTFVSYEPALRPVDWAGWEFLAWLISGGESGPDARPSHPDSHRRARDFCAERGIRYFFKQWGEYYTTSSLMTTGEPVFRQFTDFQHWVNKASTWVNGGVCLDAGGRLLRNGADFMRARDEGAFPVTIMHRVGKSRAGRLLDGVTHDGFPESGRVGAEGSRRG